MTENFNIRDAINEMAVINAVKHKGKANENAVLGMFLAVHSEYRSRINMIKPIIKEMVEAVNKLSSNELEVIHSKITSKHPDKSTDTTEKELAPLPNIDNYSKVVMRMAPYPSGPLHIGNARMVILNDYYIKRYKGRFILVFDDTIGSAVKDIVPEAYDLIKQDLEFLDVKWHETVYKSDRLEIFYTHCKKLIEMGKAYVCSCEAGYWRDQFKSTKKSCPHALNEPEKNIDEWEKMLSGTYNEGEAVVRLKTGMDLDNPALRDHVIMRISNKIHPRVSDRYKVWPLLEFSWAIDDHLLGITHILRGKDLLKEDILEKTIWDMFGWPGLEFIHYGLISFQDIKLSKTDARINIQKGIYSGWDDPRTWSLRSLAKRGFSSDVIRRLILDLGLSLADIKFSPEALYAINRSVIDSTANRYFFIAEPTQILIKNIPNQAISAQLYFHPDFPDRGNRIINLKPINNELNLLIEKKDASNLTKDEIIRLKDLMNIKIIKSTSGELIGDLIPGGIDEIREHAKKTNKKLKIIHWLPINNNIPINIIDINGNIISGIGDENCIMLKEDQIIQFERFGFCRIDKITPKIVAYYSHP